MNAARPAAGAALALGEFGVCSFNAALSGFDELRTLYPANPFIASKRSDVTPRCRCAGVGAQCLAKICRERMYGAARNLIALHAFIVQQ